MNTLKKKKKKKGVNGDVHGRGDAVRRQVLDAAVLTRKDDGAGRFVRAVGAEELRLRVGRRRRVEATKPEHDHTTRLLRWTIDRRLRHLRRLLRYCGRRRRRLPSPSPFSALSSVTTRADWSSAKAPASQRRRDSHLLRTHLSRELQLRELLPRRIDERRCKRRCCPPPPESGTCANSSIFGGDKFFVATDKIPGCSLLRGRRLPAGVRSIFAVGRHIQQGSKKEGRQLD